MSRALAGSPQQKSARRNCAGRANETMQRTCYFGVVLDDELVLVPEEDVSLDVLDDGEDELLELGVLLLLELGVLLDVSVLEDDEEVDGAVDGVLVVELLLLVLGVDDGGVTVVDLSSLFSQPATPMASARAHMLDNKMLDFMRTPFSVMAGHR
jgi:hypothetical protein